nr:hypothetical protein [Tanacetum cinerariifolium]
KMANLSEDIHFASWQQHIRLYFQRKDNGVNILKSIDEGPFQMGTFRETLAEGHEVQRLPKDIYTLTNHYTDSKDIWDNVKMLLEGLKLTKEDRESQLYDDFEHFRQHKGETIHDYYVQFAKLINDMQNIKMTMSRLTSSNTRNQATVQDGWVFVQNVQGRQNIGQENNARGAGAVGYEGAQNGVGNANSGQARQIKCYNCNGIGHIDLALNVDNVFQADDCDAFDSGVDEASIAQTMFMANLSYADPVYDEVGPSYDLDILFEYLKDNAVPVVQSNVSSVPNDAYMIILNDMHEQPSQHVSLTTQNNVVDKSLTAELATYKEQVELYKRLAKFELTEIEQKIDEQLRIVITDRNIKEENLKKELHSVKLKLTSTINHNKSMVQPALYNGYEIIKTNHVSAIMHNSKETLEIAEITRKKMNNKMKDPECVKKKVKIAPHDYSKENYLATFTPQKQLTPKQIFWSNYLLKIKEEALKEQITALRPIKSLMLYPLNTPATLVPRITKNYKSNCVTMLAVKSKVLAPDMYVIDVEPIPPRNKNNREVHLDYLKHLKVSVATLREIVEEARVEKPFDSSLASACRYKKHY